MRLRFHSSWALRSACMLGFLLALAGIRGSFGQNAAEPALLAPPSPEERAGDDAFQQLIDKVLALRLADGKTLVAALLAIPETTAPVAGVPHGAGIPERELRRVLLAQRQVGSPRRLPGGGVEVDAWLPTTRLTEILQEVTAKIPNINRARIALQAVAGPTVTATGHYVPDGRPRDDRPGWRQCTPEQIQQTRVAVDLDLGEHLLALIGSLRTPEGKLLRELINNHPRFRAALLARLKALSTATPVYEPTGICRAALSTSRKELTELIRNAAQDSGEELPAGVERAAAALDADALIIEGLAVPPPIKPRAAIVAQPAADPDRPAWAERFITIKAMGNPPPGVTDSRARRDLAVRAARVEAARLLWLEIEKLPLPSATVGDRLARHPQIRSAAAAIDALILPMSNPVYSDDDSATLTLGIRLEAVWGVLRDLH